MKKILIIALLLLGSNADAQKYIYTNKITMDEKRPTDVSYSKPNWTKHTSVISLSKDMRYIEWTNDNVEIRFTVNDSVDTESFRFYNAVRDHDGRSFDFVYTDDLVIFYFTEDGIEKRIALGVERISNSRTD